MRDVSLRFAASLRRRTAVSKHPVAKAGVCAAPVSEGGREIAPGATGADDPKNRLHKQPVVPAAAPWIARLAKTMRLHLRPLGVSQNESVHPKLESQPSPNENPESQQALGRLDWNLLFGLRLCGLGEFDCQHAFSEARFNLVRVNAVG
jgi:hypothetical protein